MLSQQKINRLLTLANHDINRLSHMNNSELARVLSPIIFFIFHVIYLLAWSQDPFLTKWLEGSFTFFLALVLCNVIRARIVAAKDQEDHAADEEHRKPKL